jgi:hypothetical protein
MCALWGLSRQSCQLLQLIDDRVVAPKHDAKTLFGHEGHPIAKLGSVPKIDRDWAGIYPAILFDVYYRGEGNTDLPNVVGDLEMTFGYAYALEASVGPKDKCRSKYPHDKKHELQLWGRQYIGSIVKGT